MVISIRYYHFNLKGESCIILRDLLTCEDEIRLVREKVVPDQPPFEERYRT